MPKPDTRALAFYFGLLEYRPKPTHPSQKWKPVFLGQRPHGRWAWARTFLTNSTATRGDWSWHPVDDDTQRKASPKTGRVHNHSPRSHNNEPFQTTLYCPDTCQLSFCDNQPAIPAGSCQRQARYPSHFRHHSGFGLGRLWRTSTRHRIRNENHLLALPAQNARFSPTFIAFKLGIATLCHER